VNLKGIVTKAHLFSRLFKVNSGGKFRLQHSDAGETLHLDSGDKPQAGESLRPGAQAQAEPQEMP